MDEEKELVKIHKSRRINGKKEALVLFDETDVRIMNVDESEW